MMKTISKKVIFILLSITFTSFSLLKGEEIKNWPREITSGKGKITIFQPEIESFSNNKMECRSAVAVKIDDQSSPVFGAIWYECRLATDRDNRTVTLLDLTVIADKFPGIEDTEVEKINSYVEQEVPKWEMVMSLDEVLTGLEFNELISSSSEKLNNEAPEIIFATSPAALILIDGEPVWEQIENINFDYVVNTPFFIARDSESGIYYLKGGDNWYSSDNIYSGWKITESIPRKLKNVESESAGEQEARPETTLPSQIIVRTSPAELLLSNGSPQYSSVENTSLLFATNTDDDIIMDINTQEYYILISGRWYKSKDLYSNNWTFVSPDNLPADFSNIHEDSPVSNVRVSVSGTQEAKEAILETRIPQTAEVDRNAAILEVFYDGDPIFEEIEGTNILYAVNTDKEVLLINNIYYCCDNAVWFESTSPLGPWIVAIEIPKDIMDIPPEYPVYNVKFVFIYDYTAEVVHSGYLQGYVHNYIYHSCVFYGTGYHYKPWYKKYYYSRPLTYGFGAHYNPYSGWGFSYGVSFEGFRWIDYDSRFNSKFEGYWGPSGYRHGYYRGVALGKKRGFSDTKPEPPKNNKNDSPSNIMARNIATSNVYLRRDNGVSRTGDYHFNPKTGKQLSDNSSGTRQAETAGRSNNLYSDQTGNVYQRKNNGNWEVQENSSRTDNRRTASTTTSNTKEKTTTPREDINTTTSRDSSTKPNISSGNTKQTGTTTRPLSQEKSTKTQSSPTARPVSTDKKTTGQNPSGGQTSPQRTTTGSDQQRQTNTNSNLNSQYDSRNRGTEKTETFNKNKTQNQYTQPQSATTQKSTPSVRSSSEQSRSPSKTATPVNKKR